MKTIVCFGDSNTWGYNPAGGARYSMEERWGSLLREELGSEYFVIEEGLCGRTTVFNDPIGEHRSGKEYIIPCIESHSPVYLVIILLGTNDLKKRFSLTAGDIANGAGILVKMIQSSNAGPNWKAPKVLLIAPPPIKEVGVFAEAFEGGEEKSHKLSERFESVSKLLGCEFLDAAKNITSSDIDGIHLEVSEHKRLAAAVAKKVRELL
ncbi:SGNH/GDSL hydrolase family protein [Clostridium swellfunianum]|uniref:SGNH/GDSL hydrolase family protein n=1 Tax=Clostridium swellfunianum TaxID=1367462 RepID=UPI00202F7E11|nr:SGNH/GDSL hydrolase family protein [Clostridium swellfunianum]MCM0648043.1 SGNH/GDSL hydrolase family protein [Clostridium swellfunianum]